MTDPVEDTRWRRLVEVVGELTANLDLEAVLARLLEAARELTGARYAALGIVDEDKRELERFLYLGIDEQTRREIGDLPRGRGILGLLIQDPQPLRLRDVGDHPRSYGFPSAHPPMHSFLGVPVTIRGESFGNLYLTEKQGGDFDEADEQIVVALAERAGVAIDNARLYEQAASRGRELEQAVRGLEATVDIANAVGSETDLSHVLELIVKRGRALVDARALVIVVHEQGELVIAATAGEIKSGVRGTRISMPGSIAERVLRSQRAERVSDAGDRMAPALHALGLDASTALVAPLVYRGRAVGVLEAFDHLGDRTDFSAEDQRLLQSFAASAATAIATAQSVERDRLQKSMEASEQERRRWARELHDDTLQGLGALRLRLSAALKENDDAAAASAVREVVAELDTEIENLRTLITELRPAALDELGLQAPLESLVERVAATSDVEADMTIDLANERGDETTRLAPEIENAAFRLVQEALNNAIRHAAAEHVGVSVLERDGSVMITVRDDGRGFDPATPSRGFGLLGMRERAELVDGSLEVNSRPGEGTVVTVVLPARRSQLPVGPEAELPRPSQQSAERA
jgi:signal transduction histidine kinase